MSRDANGKLTLASPKLFSFPSDYSWISLAILAGLSLAWALLGQGDQAHARQTNRPSPGFSTPMTDSTNGQTQTDNVWPIQNARRPVKAPPLTGGTDWLNTGGPIDIKKLRGKFVLIDFWTYCCINCIHALPTLGKLEKEFPNELVVIGVHSPKFPGEKVNKNLKEAVLRYKIKHPVVNDQDFKIWKAYGARSWPTLVLIDPQGNVIGMDSGEPDFDHLKKVLKTLIKKADEKKLLDRKPLHFDLETMPKRETALAFPGKVKVDAKGNRLFIADSSHHRVVVADLKSNKILDIIGTGEDGFADGAYDKAQFKDPQGMEIQGDILWVADARGHRLRQVDLKAKKVSTLAGDGSRGYNRSRTGLGTDLALASPWALKLVGDQLYIAMAGTHQIFVYNLKTKQVGPYAGNGRENIVDGTLKNSEFAQPSGLASDGKKLWVADSEVSGIRQIDLKTGKVTTLVGTGLFDFGDKDGIGKKAVLQHALGVVYHDGNLYVADTYNNKIKKIDLETTMVSTFVGNGKSGSGNDPVMFDEPSGIEILGDTLYIADTSNHQIRTIDLKTKAVSTLQFKGLKPPKLKTTEPALPNLTVLQHGPVSLKDAKTLTVAGSVNLKPGEKINTKAPTRFVVQKVNDDGTLTTIWKKRIALKDLAFSVPLQGVDLSSVRKIRLALTYYPCEASSEGVCYIRSLAWEVPINIDATGGKASVTLKPPVIDDSKE